MLSPNNFGTWLEIPTQKAAPSGLHANFELGEVGYLPNTDLTFRRDDR
jgi:hypothetical protein